MYWKFQIPKHKVTVFCTVAKELLFTGKIQPRGKLGQSDIGDLNEGGHCFGLSVFCSVVFFMYVQGTSNFRHLCRGVGFLEIQTAYITHFLTEPKLHLENIRDVPQYLLYFRTKETDERLWEKRQIPLWSAENISTSSNIKVLSATRDHSIQLKNQSPRKTG